MRKTFMLLALLLASVSAHAGENQKRLGFAVGALYEDGLDATLSYECEGRNHNAWEFFANGYLQWTECKSCGHVCPDSFWRNYRTWGLGVAYKPCVARGRNWYSCLRLGLSGGSNTSRFLTGIHVGFEHDWVLPHQWQVFFQVKADCMIGAGDLFREGVALGVKVPL